VWASCCREEREEMISAINPSHGYGLCFPYFEYLFHYYPINMNEENKEDVWLNLRHVRYQKMND